MHQGLMNQKRIEDVRTGKYPGHEGVVAKGVRIGKSNTSQHGLWMAKIKTNRWLKELKQQAKTSEELRNVLSDNLAEQGNAENAES